MLDGDRVALHARDARRGRVEQRVNEVVGQQVDLVDVEDPRCARASSPGSKACSPLKRTAEVQRADQPVERRAQRQLDERRRPRPTRRVVPAPGRPAPRSPGANANGCPAAASHRRQQRRQPAHRRRLRGAALAADEHAADVGRDGVDQQRLDERAPARRSRSEGRRRSCARLLELALRARGTGRGCRVQRRRRRAPPTSRGRPPRAAARRSPAPPTGSTAT